MSITRALLSVSDKSGLAEFAKFLHEQGVELLSTGGSAKAIREAGVPVKDVSEHTGFPEMMDGRVKTLHPAIHGGLLALRDNPEHQAAMAEQNIAPIDLVVVNLYPFEETVAKGADFATCIENIDIGGPSMVRSAAKNHHFVTIVVDPADYEQVMDEMKQNHGATTPDTRKALAAKAFSRTAAYDSAISNWFARERGDIFPERLTLSATRQAVLHYGENPHQKGAFYATSDAPGPNLATAEQVQGAGLSYNNYNDASAAYELVREFAQPAVAIIKHANPCGVAVGKDVVEAYQNALACDPVSAYGGIIAVNRHVDVAFCDALGKLFCEVMIAPSVSDDAKARLSEKKKLKLLIAGELTPPAPRLTYRTVSGGLLCQEDDLPIIHEQLNCVTKTAPSQQQMEDLIFAFTVAKHVKSNTIVLAKNNATVGIGAGQMSRIDSTRIACWKAGEAKLETKGCVLASDAFFPFPDNVEMAAEAGITAIIQPGGSIRDDEVIKAADDAGITMLFTGIRHFRH